jgi:hypothetical protein
LERSLLDFLGGLTSCLCALDFPRENQLHMQQPPGHQEKTKRPKDLFLFVQLAVFRVYHLSEAEQQFYQLPTGDKFIRRFVPWP